MLRNISLLVVSLLCLYLLFEPLLEEPVPAAAPSPVAEQGASLPLARRLEALEADLDAALVARQQLEKRLELLERQVLMTSELAPAQTRPSNEQLERAENPPPADEPPPVEVLLAEQGLDANLITRIKRHISANQLQRLEWRDRAIREGWQQSDEFTEKMHEFSDPLRGVREEFGDQAFDRYLYAAGQTNRVRVRSVISGSAAAQGGVQAGDLVAGYAGMPIFSMQVLRMATTEGIAGEPVLVELERAGQPVAITVPRGPLGITMESIRMAPE